jgi:hypothetical protein
VDTAMITLQADFNHLDAQGRLRLGDLRMHQQTPFAQIAAKNESILFVDGEDVVRGELIQDPQEGWIAKVDWSTQDVWEAYPPAAAAR